MKILQIENLVFRLPDDFSGTFADALRALARYHESGLKSMRLKNKPAGRLTRKTWKAFVEIVGKGGRLASLVSIQEWTGKAWRRLPNGS